MSADQENPKNDSNSEEQLPDWLREIRGESPAFQSKGDSKPELPPETESSVSEIEELPEWLQGEPEDFDEIAPASEGDAIVEEAADVAEVSAESITDEPVTEEASGMEMWEKILAEEGVSLDDVPDERPEGAEDMSVKDWMIATADESAKRQAQAGVETPAASDEETSAEPQGEISAIDETQISAEVVEDDGMVLEDDLPDWLKDDTVAEAEDDGVPSWLTDDSVVAKIPQTESVVEDEALSEAADVAEEFEAEVEDDEMVIDEDLPDWLKEDVVAETEDESAPAWLSDESVVSEIDEASVAEVAEVEDETLLEAADVAEEFEAEVEADEMVIDEDLPDWLKEDVIAETEDEGVPAWLSDESVVSEIDEASVAEVAEVEDEALLEAADIAEEFEAEVEDDEMVIDEDLPDWLKEDVVAETEDESVPAWLSDESVVSETTDATLEGDIVVDDDEAETLDWLEEGEESWSEVPAETKSEAVIATDAVEAEAIDDVEADVVPDWLEETETDSVMAAQTLGEEEPEIEETVEEVEDEAVESVEAVSEAEAILDESLAQEEAQEMLSETETVLDQSLAEQLLTEDEMEPLRAALEVGQVDEALTGLSRLIEKAAHLDDVVNLLSKNTEVYPENSAVFETLGDAQMKLGQLNQAFQSYKTALKKL